MPTNDFYKGILFELEKIGQSNPTVWQSNPTVSTPTPTITAPAPSSWHAGDVRNMGGGNTAFAPKTAPEQLNSLGVGFDKFKQPFRQFGSPLSARPTDPQNKFWLQQAQKVQDNTPAYNKTHNLELPGQEGQLTSIQNQEDTLVPKNMGPSPWQYNQEEMSPEDERLGGISDRNRYWLGTPGTSGMTQQKITDKMVKGINDYSVGDAIKNVTGNGMAPHQRQLLLGGSQQFTPERAKQVQDAVANKTYNTASVNQDGTLNTDITKFNLQGFLKDHWKGLVATIGIPLLGMLIYKLMSGGQSQNNYAGPMVQQNASGPRFM